jgi:tripartite-type tricarboxylate transporter receptor subunit TctC
MVTGIWTRSATAACLFASVLWSAGASADSVADFYKKHDLDMYVGSGAGGGYDVYARLFARDYARFIPGHPNIVVKDMPGAAGLKATNYVYNIAPKDGSSLLATFNTVLMEQLYGDPGVQFDPRKFSWIGSMGKQTGVCITWHTTGVKTLDDARKREVTAGATGGNATPTIFPKILNKYFGTKFKVITGYTTTGVRLALEKGEVQAICGISYQTHMAVSPQWFEKHEVNVLVQLGLTKNPSLPGVPLAIDMLKDKNSRAVFKLIVSPQEFGRPIVGPPGIPANRLKALRTAFTKTMKDKEFLAHAKKAKLAIEPIYHTEIENILKDAYAAPKSVVAEAAVFAAQPKAHAKK